VHRLDLALWLMEYPKPTWVMGSAYDHIAKERAKREGKAFDVEDLAAGMVKFENGATLEIEASWAANIKERELMSTRLLGTKAGLLQRNVEEGYKWDAEIFLEREGCQYDMKLHPPVPEANSSMYHFVDCIVDEKPHIATRRRASSSWTSSTRLQELRDGTSGPDELAFLRQWPGSVGFDESGTVEKNSFRR
jgi:predicted dehydrogenase